AASDGSPDGRRKLARHDRVVIDLFDRDVLSAALGKENVVHAAVLPDGLGARFIAEAKRLVAYRQAPVAAKIRPKKHRSQAAHALASRSGLASGKTPMPGGSRTIKLVKGKATSHE